MTSELKFTPWFTKGEKPTRIGVYNVSCQKTHQTGRWYAYWTGDHFCLFQESVHTANECIKEPSRLLDGKRGSWRGLATQTGK